MLFFLPIENFRSYFWGKVILELFTIAHPHVELKYLLTGNKDKTNQATDCTKMINFADRLLKSRSYSEIVICVTRSRLVANDH